MEQDVKLGSVGDAKLSESQAGESATASVLVGPLKVSVAVELDNKALLELVASKVPGGLAHEAVVALEKVLFPSA